MPTTRPRQIVRRAAMTVVVIVLLPVCYLGSALSLCLAAEMGWLAPTVENSPLTQMYVVPASWYLNDSGLPGAKAYEAVFDSCYEALEIR